ncbi:putative S-layer protein [Marinitoga piezophila KA3]|uniref:Putative S-layer protein n=1 Tax=Marinitoga piezophila (strain DSM 14283 / JCM 11233 / KA3) TaxID=443254 RepID=H2J5H3_MARPK|nr:S-layer homology domain-containing protein [Marinitoga piezophila]AEX86117.1 putative S-layer protein [Marinitoga piezophila KA3]
MRKALLVMALVLFGIYSFAFVDVPEDHWAYEYVMDLANRGILPMEDNFNPDVVLTKAEVAELLSDTLTYIENDPVLAKAEDIKRVETVMGLLNKKLDDALSVKSDVSKLKGETSRKLLETKYMVLDLGDRVTSLENALSKNTDDVSVNTENIDGLWEELETLQSDLDYVSGENVKAHEELKALIAKKADVEKVKELSEELNKVSTKLETITKVAYRAFNNADMVVEDMLDLSDSVDSLNTKVSTIEGNVNANTEKINAVEEKANSANTMAMVGIGAAVLAAVLAFVF